MSLRESSSVQVLAAPEAARTPRMVSRKLRRFAYDDIAEITGGSFSRPHASVICDGSMTALCTALLHALAGRMHWVGWAKRSHLKTRFVACTVASERRVAGRHT